MAESEHSLRIVTAAGTHIALTHQPPWRFSKEFAMFKGFKNFLMQGDLIVIAVGLVVALAFSTLIKAFTDSIITAAIYFVLVVPYKAYMKKQGTTVFGKPAPTKKCPYCLSGDLPVDATKCKYCASELSAAS